MKLIRRIQALIQRRRQHAELVEEMEFHRAMAEQEEQSAGVSEQDARHAARRRMGNETLALEDARRVWLAAWLESVVQDLRYGWRSLVHQPGFTLLAMLALVLGIGISTSLFTLFNAVALRPWPVHEPSRVVTLLTHSNQRGRRGYGGFSIAEYRFLSEHSRTLSGIILMRSERMDLDQQPDGPRSMCHFVSGNYFSVLAPEMELGRGLTPEDDRLESPAAVAVLSYATWQSRYGADPLILGKRVRLDDIPFAVVGVAGPDFTGTSPDRHDVWVPLAALPVAQPNEPSAKALLTEPGFCCSQAAGRLAPGGSREQARAELTALAGQFQRLTGGRPEDDHAVEVAGTAFLARPDAKRKVIPALAILSAAVGLVLLLACANVSNLLLARGAARQREIAVRVSIGAGRTRIVRQLLTESVLLAAGASCAALALAYWLPDFVMRRVVQDPPSFRLTPDTTVLFYSIGIALVTAAAFGLTPAIRITRVSVSDAMKQQGANSRQRFPLRGTLTGVQVAVSVVLLVGAGLLIRGLGEARTRDPGFLVEGVSQVSVDLPASRYNESQSQAYFTKLIERLQASSGSKVALAARPPLANSRMMTNFTIPGRPDFRQTMVLVQPVDGAYFDVLGIPVTGGRSFTAADAKRHVTVINEAMAKRYWPDVSPVGQAIQVGTEQKEIIGVVRDAQVYGLGPVEPVCFMPFDGDRHGVILMRTPDSHESRQSLAAAATQSEPRAVVSVTPLTEQMDRWLGSSRAAAGIASALGLLALLLATVGVYGVIAYSVQQRRREIGVRLALGAPPRGIIWSVLKTNSRAILIGLVVGLAGSLAASQLLTGALYGISPLDPLAYAGVLLVLLAAGLAASAIPARRAVRTDPVAALHCD